MRRGLVGIPQSAGCRRSPCAIQDDDGSGSPSLGADTCANRHKALMIGAMCASSLLAGAASDDATGAGDGRCVRGSTGAGIQANVARMTHCYLRLSPAFRPPALRRSDRLWLLLRAGDALDEHQSG